MISGIMQQYLDLMRHVRDHEFLKMIAPVLALQCIWPSNALCRNETMVT